MKQLSPNLRVLPRPVQESTIERLSTALSEAQRGEIEQVVIFGYDPKTDEIRIYYPKGMGITTMIGALERCKFSLIAENS